MPSIPNFSIPRSPFPPPPTSEAAALLAARTKKFERFLALKATGVHFNARLAQSKALRDPGVGAKLMEFAGVTLQDSYANTLDGGVGLEWGEEEYVEELMRRSERAKKKMAGERERVEFVSAAAGVGGEGVSSRSGTPKGAGGKAAGGLAHRKSRFDQR